MSREINFTLQLTGSQFFDIVMLARAGELEKKYPGLSIRREQKQIIIGGTLDDESAESFYREVE